MLIFLGFWDESGISLRPVIRRTWAPKGQTPVICTTGSWKKRSVIGIITCTPLATQPKLYLRIFKGTVGSKEIIRSFKGLRRHLKGNKMILLWDRLPAHRSDEVKDFLKTQREWLEVKKFPAYAPELNPLDYLWSPMKTRDLANLYLEAIDDIDSCIRKSARRIQRRPDLITGFLKASKLFEKELSK